MGCSRSALVRQPDHRNPRGMGSVEPILTGTGGRFSEPAAPLDQVRGPPPSIGTGNGTPDSAARTHLDSRPQAEDAAGGPSPLSRGP